MARSASLPAMADWPQPAGAQQLLYPSARQQLLSASARFIDPAAAETQKSLFSALAASGFKPPFKILPAGSLLKQPPVAVIELRPVGLSLQPL
jgi:hypothetical protein